jgi:hypothetical protein
MKDGTMKGAAEKDTPKNTVPWTVLPFPCASRLADRRGLRKDLLTALRVSGSPVIVDFSDCRTLNYQDIDLLLECVAEAAGRDTKVLFVAGSRVNRVLLEVTRISSLVPVFDSIREALAYPQIASENDVEDRLAS